MCVADASDAVGSECYVSEAWWASDAGVAGALVADSVAW